MSYTPFSSLIVRLRTRLGEKLLRFGAVSAFNVVFGQSLLFAAQTVFNWTAVGSNIFSVSVSAIPAYLLSRYWVWQKRGKNHFMREVLPFWTLALLITLLTILSITPAEAATLLRWKLQQGDRFRVKINQDTKSA